MSVDGRKRVYDQNDRISREGDRERWRWRWRNRRRKDGRVGRDASPWMQARTFGQGIRLDGKQMVCEPFIRQKKKKITNTKKKKALINRVLKKRHYSPAAAFLGGFLGGEE